MDGCTPDRSWVYDRLNPNRGGLKPGFAKGVEEFIKKAVAQPEVVREGGIRCPCVKCRCRNIFSASQIRVHLYKVGFQPNYYYWTEHGEDVPHIDPRNVSSSIGEMDDDPFTLMQDMVDDAFGPRYDFKGMGDEDNEKDDDEINEEPPNKEEQDFYDLLTATQLAAVEARVRAAEEEVRQAREAVRLAEECSQQAEQRAANFQRQLRELADSVAAIQAQPTRRPRHPDYEEDESDGEDH